MKDDWSEALLKARILNIDSVPKGWIRAEDFCKKFDCSMTQARESLRDMLAKKIVEKRKFRVECHGMDKRIIHYRLLK